MLSEILPKISKSRNKIIIVKSKLPLEEQKQLIKQEIDIDSIDIGLEFSQQLKDNISSLDLPFIAIEKFVQLCENKTELYDNQPILVMHNMGILFEKELNINFENILLKLSKNIVMILLWDGGISDENLFFLSREHGVKVKLNHEQYYLMEI